LLRGRLFDGQDVTGHPLVVIVDTAFADRFFPHQDPIGKQIHDPGPISDRRQYTIVGVVPAVRHDELGAEPRLTQLYFPAGQSAELQVRLLLRTNGEPTAYLRPVRDAIHAVDPEVPVFEARTMIDAVSTKLAPQQLALDLISVFSLLALGLAMLGLYGILAQTVSQRTREIGVRLASGSQSTPSAKFDSWERYDVGWPRPWHRSADRDRFGSSISQTSLQSHSYGSNNCAADGSSAWDRGISWLPGARLTSCQSRPR
jgi:hypothetical protein